MSSQRRDWRERLHANPSRMELELAFKQQDQINYQTQVEIPVTTADFYFPLEPRPLIVFVDGQAHLGKIQMIKDEELRTLLRKKGYRVQELFDGSYFEAKRDRLYKEILDTIRAGRLDTRVIHSLSSPLSACCECMPRHLFVRGFYM